MKDIRLNTLLAIKPRFADDIYSGRKTLELRQTSSLVPKNLQVARAYLYETAPTKAVTGYVTLSKPSLFDIYLESANYQNLDDILRKICIEEDEARSYLRGCLGFLYPISYAVKFEHRVSSQELKELGIYTPQGFNRLNVDAENSILELQVAIS